MSDLLTEVLQTLLPAAVSGVVVALVGQHYAAKSARDLENLRASQTRQSAYFERQIQAHEDLWPLIAACNRAQEQLTRDAAKECDVVLTAWKRVGAARRALKNFVYDRGLYFDENTRRIVQDLDTELADPNVVCVAPTVRRLEERLQGALEELLGARRD